MMHCGILINIPYWLTYSCRLLSDCTSVDAVSIVSHVLLVVIESCGFVRTLIPISDDSADSSSLYIGTTKNFIMEGWISERFTIVLQVSLFY